MGLTRPTIYLDSCIIIYLVEEHPAFAPIVEGHLALNVGVSFAFSSLSELECLVIPFRRRDAPVIAKFSSWFGKSVSLRLPRNIYLQAAQLRADHSGLKTPDALHLATALHHGCTEFWTNDERLHKIAPRLAKNVCEP